MKISLNILFLSIILTLNNYSELKSVSNPHPVLIIKEDGKHYTFKYCDNYELQYEDGFMFSHYLKFTEKNKEEYELIVHRYSSKMKDIPKIEVVESISIPEDGSAPETSSKKDLGLTKLLTFASPDQEFYVLFGEKVNISYGAKINPKLYYIRFKARDNGYTLRLTNRLEPQIIEFYKLCQIEIVATPQLTSIIAPFNLRFEQIIWTPRKDGMWEVRIGTSQDRHCNSEALKGLKNLWKSDPNYEKNLPK